MNRWTELVHYDPCPEDPFHPSSTPIYQTATFAQEEAAQCGRFDYSRSGNPTRAVLEERLARLEGASRAFAFGSGMAAIAALCRLLSAGDELIAGDDLYGGTYRLLNRLLVRQGVTVSHVDMSDLDAVESALGSRSRLLLAESPTNPLQRIVDIPQLSRAAHAHGALLAVDSTLVSPWLQQPLALGADLVIHSATKHLAGHSDLCAGVLAVNDPQLGDELAFIQNAVGSALSPFDSWLLLRGLQTLPLRLERAQQSADRIARFLASHEAVERVHYPGLEDHPGHALHKRQAHGAGSLISFEMGCARSAERVVNDTRLFTISVSFGGLRSLISLPRRMSHASITDFARTLPADLVRLSVGIEDPDDLIADLGRALGNSVQPRACASVRREESQSQRCSSMMLPSGSAT